MSETVLIVAPHPDDELLGVGGTLLRHLAEGDHVHVVICTRGEPPRFSVEQVRAVQAEARAAHAFVGVTGSHFLDLPAAGLDRRPGAEVNEALGAVFQKVAPSVVYVPHAGDVHRDHQLVFQAAMVCCRPSDRPGPARIRAYETVSETDWYAPPLTPAFVPNVYVEITRFVEKKLAACALYASQIRQPPHQRSLEGLRALSVTRGHAVGVPHAEAFMLIREVVT
jgi:LmbE family N-acetylglucosaminyl deacetylase